MDDFIPYITADGSVGLYSTEFQDIYHSAGGAATESLEKFVLPINFDNLLSHDEIKVLDICYGIGYNTKTFLNYLIKNYKNFYKMKKKYQIIHANQSEAIHTDNIPISENSTNTETIYTDKNKCLTKNLDNTNCSAAVYSDKIFNKIYINAIDNNKILPLLSPFINIYPRIKQNNDEIPVCGLKKYFKLKKYKKYKYFPEINYLLFNSLLNSDISTGTVIAIHNFLCRDSKYFLKNFTRLLESFIYSRGINKPNRQLFSNLHNIYYRYVSNSYKRRLNSLKIGDIMFCIKNNDARNIVLNDKSKYNLIFLDAFSPSKCPCLWSYEFFKELFRLLSDDGMLLTYSTSAVVRSAMVEAGFFIGNNISSERKVIGTLAAKNSNIIEHPLSNADFGLLKSRAGIFYRDKNLTGQNEAIIKAHKFEVDNSDRISTTAYLKTINKEAKCTMS